MQIKNKMPKLEIIPTVLTADYDELTKLVSYVRGLCPVVQIDFCDGLFVGNKTWPYSSGEHPSADTELPFPGEFDYEFDIMARHPEKSIDGYMEMNPSRVIFHIESTDEDGLIEAAEKAHDEELMVGLSSSNDIDMAVLKERIMKLEGLGIKPFVQFMGIANVGFKGQPFDERVLGRIKELRGQFPELDISVDGSVNMDTLPRLREAGANRFVIGSALMLSGDVPGMLKKFEALL